MSYWLAPGGLHVTFGEPGDAPALAAIHAEGFFRGWPVSEFEAYLAAPGTTPVYIATDAKRRIAGFALMRVIDREAEVLTIAVARRMRGKKIAKALMRAALDDLSRHGVKTLFLEVEDANAPAIGLYRAHGFQTVSTRQGYYPRPDGSAATALVMRADLG